MGIGFKITVEFYCENMIDKECFLQEFEGNAEKAYRFISNNYEDSPLNYSTSDKIVKIEILDSAEGKIKVSLAEPSDEKLNSGQLQQHNVMASLPFEHCGKGENICSCTRASECGYLSGNEP